MDRSGGAPGQAKARLERALLDAAGRAGVPVPAVVAAPDFDEDADADADADPLGGAWLVVERLEGETIPRKILRDPQWAAARAALTAQCGRALAAVHTIDPATIEGLPRADPLRDPLPLLDALAEVRPALELGVRWLAAHRPDAGPTPPSRGHGPRRLPLREPARRPRRPPGRPRLGARPRRRPGRGRRLALRAGLALRRPGRGRRLRRGDRPPGGVRGGRRRPARARARPLVAGLRHGEVGRHLPRCRRRCT